MRQHTPENRFALRVGKIFGSYKDIKKSVEGLDDCEMPTKSVIKATANNRYPWPGPKDQQNKTDKLLSAYDAM